MPHPQVPKSKHFRLEQVADGVYAVMHIEGGTAIGNADSLVVFAEYVRTLDGMARQMVEDGEAEETIDEMPLPEPYADWLFAAFFPVNMHFLYQHWQERTAAS